MLKILKTMKPRDMAFFIPALLFIVVQVWLDLRLPDYMSEITRLVETPGSAMNEVLTAGAKMLGCAAGSLGCAMIVAVISAHIGINFSAELREKLFRRVQDFSMEEIADFSTASLITRSTNDIQQVQLLIVMGLQAIVKAPIMAIWAIMKIYNKSIEWTLTTGAAVLILLVIVSISTALVMPKFKQMQRLTDELNRVTRENLTGLNVVRAYNAEGYQENKFTQANNNLTNTNLFAFRVMSFMMPAIGATMNGLNLAIYWIGAALIAAARMGDKLTIFSNMVVFSAYAMQIIMAFFMLVMIFMMWPRASVAAKRILEVLETTVHIKDGDKTQGVQDLCGQIEFKNVSFKYPDAENAVLENISFTANKGDTVAIIGATGCGKSSVINLIPRFYDVSEGQVLVDGVDVREYTQTALRNKIGYVSQKALLFSGDIASNIAYGDTDHGVPSEDDIKRAASIAQAQEFIDAQEKGFASHVAQGGTNFSGGQKQRLSIARAIARKPEILLFDDSFSALDYKTDKILRDTLREECSDITKIIVAQRIGTIRDADTIIVLEDGKIVGQGTHDELMQSSDVYQEIALSQLSKEELA